MIELRGEHVALRALEREHCHTLWELTETLGMSRRSTFSWDLLRNRPTNGLKKFKVSRVRLELISAFLPWKERLSGMFSYTVSTGKTGLQSWD